MNKLLVDTPGTIRPLLTLALPVLVEQLLNLVVVYSDTALAGHLLESQHLAAMTLVAYLMWLVNSLFAIVGIGATAMTARHAGARDLAGANRATHQALLLGGVVTVAAAALVYTVGPALISALFQQRTADPLAARFLQIVAVAMPAIMVTQVLPACLRGAGDTVTGMIALCLVNAVNVAVSWTLAIGAFGLPKMGWDGLAIGTAAGYAVGAAFLLVIFSWRGRAGMRLMWRQLRPDPGLLRRMLYVGVPGGSDMLAIVLCHLWFVAVIGKLGSTSLAAHGVAVRIEALAYLPGTAFQYAAATLAGQYLGAQDYARANRSVWMACLAGGALMTAGGVVMFFGADFLVRVFVEAGKVEVLELSAPPLRIVAFAMPALAVLSVLIGALRGAGDTRWPLLFTLIGMLGVRIPLAYLLTQYFDLGLNGAWYAMMADIFTRCPLACLRFWHGGWKHARV